MKNIIVGMSMLLMSMGSFTGDEAKSAKPAGMVAHPALPSTPRLTTQKATFNISYQGHPRDITVKNAENNRVLLSVTKATGFSASLEAPAKAESIMIESPDSTIPDPDQGKCTRHSIKLNKAQLTSSVSAPTTIIKLTEKDVTPKDRMYPDVCGIDVASIYDLTLQVAVP